MSVMITKCKIDSVLADTCISHLQKGTIKSYFFHTYKDVEDAFEKYWKSIRDEAKLISMSDI